MVSAEQDGKTLHPLSVNEAINNMNMGNKNTIKGDNPNTQCSNGVYAQTSSSLTCEHIGRDK